jgi:RecA-family ATPase
VDRLPYKHRSHKLSGQERSVFGLGAFTDRLVWCAWRQEGSGKSKTKRPYRSPEIRASHGDANTWISINRAAEIAATEGWISDLGGIGIFLGIPCPDDEEFVLAGLDLDSCRNPTTGELSEWASLALLRFDTYGEVSPSQTGVKLLFKLRKSQLAEIRELMGGNEWSRNYKQARTDNKPHPPGFELHIGHRYFAVTNDVHEDCPDQINPVFAEDIRWLFDEIGPQFANPDDIECEVDPMVGGDISEPKPAGLRDPNAAKDNSRSARTSRRLSYLYRTGKVRTIDEAREGLLDPDYEDKGIREWMLEKGLVKVGRQEEREFRRAWRFISQFGKNFHARQYDSYLESLAEDASLDAEEIADLREEEPVPPPQQEADYVHPLIRNMGAVDFSAIPPRPWLYGNIVCRHYLSLLFGAGGVGKTAILAAIMVSLATERKLLGDHVFKRCRTLYVSLEDDSTEVDRRIFACCLHHGIPQSDLDGWLFSYNVSLKKLVTVDKKGGEPKAGPLYAELLDIIKKQAIECLVIDPFKKVHGCEENNNTQIDYVADMLTNLAITQDIAVVCLHHVAKRQNEPGDADVGRGASALKDAARLAFTVTPMTEAEARSSGIEPENRGAYVRFDNAKSNLAPRGGGVKWIKLVGVELGNFSDLYEHGDNVQTVEAITLCDLSKLEHDKKLLQAILAPILDNPHNYHIDRRLRLDRQLWPLIEQINAEREQDERPTVSFDQLKELLAYCEKQKWIRTAQWLPDNALPGTKPLTGYVPGDKIDEVFDDFTGTADHN